VTGRDSTDILATEDPNGDAVRKPYSDACEENKGPLLDVIAPRLREARRVLEIGSGTGQHAVCFAAAMPQLIWQTSDIAPHLAGIRCWLDEAPLSNLPPPIALDVTADWPEGPYDAVFSANTAHIMGLTEVEAMFDGVGRVLAAGGLFALYGPFQYAGRHTSESNARFDGWLRAGDPRMGVRDLDTLVGYGARAGLILEEDIPMPVNNRTLIWRREPPRAEEPLGDAGAP
jgi:hypothetical protein